MVATYGEVLSREQTNAEALATLPVRKEGDELTELRSLASVKNTFGPVSIERQNRHRQITVLSNLGAGKPLGEAVQDVEAIAAEVGLPPGVTAVFTGTAHLRTHARRRPAGACHGAIYRRDLMYCSARDQKKSNSPAS